MKTQRLQTDILIIGGGTAGCYAALTLATFPKMRVLVVDKANIDRSGCLAAGVNALNAYIGPGHVPQDYVEYARKDANGIVRDDLLLSIAQRFNRMAADLEQRGLVILKNPDGSYAMRGWRNVKINGENIKPILAKHVRAQSNVQVLEHVNLTSLKTTQEMGQTRVIGACGFGIHTTTFYDITAQAVIVTTGGAAGLYRPNNPGFSRHKMWYSPFNTGAGLAMGIEAGAEMTTLENRFVALRCKDTIAPTGTIAQGVGAKQVNARGEVYETKYGLTTPERIYGTVEENRTGRGPCYLQTIGISSTAEQDLIHAYLNMAPAQALKWLTTQGPAQQNVEIEGTEPYVVGGHTAGGYWVDTSRQTTLKGLFAAGDIAGGAPQKYVTGAMAEGEIAAQSAAEFVQSIPFMPTETVFATQQQETMARHLQNSSALFTVEDLEEAMQKTMDAYAGGMGTDYRYNHHKLTVAETRIRELQTQVPTLAAQDGFELLQIYELRERLLVCRALLAHMTARKETRWHIFGEYVDYPQTSAEYACYINSHYDRANDSFTILHRPLVKGAHYEHTH